MQTTAATSAAGHTDLLSGILKVQVRNDEKITEQDRIYCQNQQDELYKTLDQIDGWYNLFKKEADKYEGKIKLKHEENGKITTSSYDLHYRYNNDREDYTLHEFTPFKDINDLVDSHQGAVKNFINRIIGYFNKTYHVSVEAPAIDEKALPMDFRPVYTTYVDVVIEHLGDKSFRDTAEEELIKRFLDTVICFNTTWAGDKIDTSLQRDVKAKWHPPGCDTVKAVFDHELGHEIDRLLGLRSHAGFLKLHKEETAKGKQHIVDNLSTYGYQNTAEFIAEAWSEYLNNETPRPIAAAVGTLIKKLYADKFQAPSSSSSP